jgi:hypothetical protein
MDQINNIKTPFLYETTMVTERQFSKKIKYLLITCYLLPITSAVNNYECAHLLTNSVYYVFYVRLG